MIKTEREREYLMETEEGKREKEEREYLMDNSFPTMHEPRSWSSEAGLFSFP